MFPTVASENPLTFLLPDRLRTELISVLLNPFAQYGFISIAFWMLSRLFLSSFMSASVNVSCLCPNPVRTSSCLHAASAVSLSSSLSGAHSCPPTRLCPPRLMCSVCPLVRFFVCLGGSACLSGLYVSRTYSSIQSLIALHIAPTVCPLATR